MHMRTWPRLLLTFHISTNIFQLLVAIILCISEVCKAGRVSWDVLLTPQAGDRCGWSDPLYFQFSMQRFTSTGTPLSLPKSHGAPTMSPGCGAHSVTHLDYNQTRKESLKSSSQQDRHQQSFTGAKQSSPVTFMNNQKGIFKVYWAH